MYVHYDILYNKYIINIAIYRDKIPYFYIHIYKEKIIRLSEFVTRKINSSSFSCICNNIFTNKY